MAMFRYILPLLLVLSVLREVSSATRGTRIHYASTTTAGTTVPPTKAAAVKCATPACPSCPPGYQIYYEHTYQCQYRCLCEVSRYWTTTLKPSMSKNLLLSILHNIQNNANALEQMASGLSDEADLAQEAAALPYR